MRTTLLLFAVLYPSLVAVAQSDGAPDLISHQGLLADTNGDPVADGTYNMVFSLYTVPSGGAAVWSEVHNGGSAVQTVDGIFNIELGSITSLSEVAFDSLLYLGVSINGDPEMMPRTALTSVPYALSLRNMRIVPETADDGPNMIGGWSGNLVSPSVVGATISGGGDPKYPTTQQVPNTVEDDFGTIGGGFDNTTSGFGATIAGGSRNTAGGMNATVGGGSFNTANGASSTVPGGGANYAGGQNSFAAGFGAKVQDGHDGTFVWADRSVVLGNFASTGENQFLIRAAGGVGIGTNSPQNNALLHVEHGSRGTNDWGVVIGNTAAASWLGGVRLSDSGFLEVTNNADNDGPSFARLDSGGNWTAVSDRRLKTEIEPASGLLDAALELEPVTYRFKHQDSTGGKSLGLIAQDVQTVIPSLVAEGDILTLNYAGLSVVAVGAIQELHRQNLEKERRIAALETRLAKLESLVRELTGPQADSSPLSAR